MNYQQPYPYMNQNFNNPLNMIMQFFANGNNPQQIIQQMASQNPQWQTFMNQYNQSGMSMKDFVYQYSKQSNINIQPLVDMLSKRGIKL